MNTIIDSEPLVTVGECARLLRVHPNTVRRWIREGRISALRIGGGTYRVRVADLDRLLAGE